MLEKSTWGGVSCHLTPLYLWHPSFIFLSHYLHPLIVPCSLLYNRGWLTYGGHVITPCLFDSFLLAYLLIIVHCLYIEAHLWCIHPLSFDYYWVINLIISFYLSCCVIYWVSRSLHYNHFLKKILTLYQSHKSVHFIVIREPFLLQFLEGHN